MYNKADNYIFFVFQVCQFNSIDSSIFGKSFFIKSNNIKIIHIKNGKMER